VVGALGRDAADVAAVYCATAGYDPQDATTADLPLGEMTLDARAERPLQGLRVGVPEEYFVSGLQVDVETAVRQAIQALESLGASAQPLSLPHTRYALPVYYLIAPAEASANLARYDGIRYGPRQPADTLLELYRHTRGERFGAEVKRRIMLGTYALSTGYYDAYYGQAQKVRTLIRGDFESAFESVDVIAAPVAPTTAFKIGEHAEDPLAMYLEDVYTLPANLAGLPGLAFPVGFDHQGLPIGMQLMGAPFQEETLLRTAAAYQGVTDWHQHQPAL
jgi:aspartyl-tRNA(Asn)/glutamyl-tRNA(Gln) amidotransferase subunit A